MTQKGTALAGAGAWLALSILVSAVPAYAQQALERSRQPAPNVSRLIRELQSPDLNHRKAAARELSTIEQLPPEAIQALAELLETSQQNDRAERYAITALDKAGAGAIPALTPLLESKNPQAREAAVQALGSIGRRDPAVWPILIGTFKENSVRWYAAFQLAYIGAPVVPLLRKSLKDNDPTIRYAALRALDMAPGAARDSTVEITSELKDPDPNIRIMAARDLGRIGPAAKTAVAALSSTLNDNRRDVREEAAYALAGIDSSDRAPIPILIENLKLCRYVGENWRALDALDGMGSNARDAAPILKDVLVSDQDPRCRAPIAKVLGQVAGAGAAPVLARTLTDDQDSQVRFAALTAIIALGPERASAIPALVKALGDGNRATRDGAAKTLADLGETARPALIAALQSPDLYTRESAMRALGEAKPLPDNVVRALTTTATNDKSRSLRRSAAEVLDRAGVQAGRTILAQLHREDASGDQEAQTGESNHLYSRAEIFADIPPGDEHEYPLHLVYLLSFNRSRDLTPTPEFLATVYRGIDRPDQFDVWKSVDGEKYQRLQVFDAGIEFEPSDKFDPPRIFFPKGQVPGLGLQCLDVGVSVWRSHTDFLFVIDGDKLSPVEIESPEQWYHTKLRLGEEIEGAAGNSFSDAGSKFQFYIRSGRASEQVTGTYKLVKDFVTGPGLEVHHPDTGVTVSVGGPVIGTRWKMVVDTAEREPRPTQRPQGSTAR